MNTMKLYRDVGLQIGSFGGEKIYARNYVHDGLIMMLDGIENEGYNIHSDNISIWKDLVGQNDATLSGSYEIQNNGIVFHNGGCGMFPLSYSLPNTTIEVVYRYDGIAGNYSIPIAVLNANGYWNNCCNVSLLAQYYKNEFGWWHYKVVSAYRVSVPFPDTILYGERKHIYVSMSNRASYLNGKMVEDNIWKDYYNSSFTALNNASWVDTEQEKSTTIGKIFAVRFYNRQLTDSEILRNYRVDCARFG